jgi:hypothetical protein
MAVASVEMFTLSTWILKRSLNMDEQKPYHHTDLKNTLVVAGFSLLLFILPSPPWQHGYAICCRWAA